MARFNRTGKGGSLLDIGVAALAALSSGFLVYAMPDAFFSRIVVASRLPQFLAAAQPPLGMKARLAVIAVIAVLVYAFIWSLMRALDAIGRKPQAVFTAEPEAPRLRRADAHPDAPSRPPIFAGRDLGEPEIGEEPLELETEVPYAPEPAYEPATQHEPENGSGSLPAFLVAQEPEPESWEEPAPVAQAAQPLAFPEESVAFPEEPVASPEQPAASAEEPVVPHVEEPADEIYDEYDEEAEESAAETDGEDQSLTRLMQRFESGLGRKQQALDVPPPVAVPASEPEPEPEPEPDPVPQERVGHRLRSAISDLGKISAPGR